MKSKFLLGTTLLATLLGVSVGNAATYTYVGNWEVDQGPSWYGSPPNGPLAYTGQEAAALLYGGNASDYAISTVGSDAGSINFQSWYSIIGVSGGSSFADNYSSKYLGSYYGPTSGYDFGNPANAASAYVSDNATGSDFTNYAFRVSGVPLPASAPMFGAALIAFGAVGYGVKRKKAASAA